MLKTNAVKTALKQGRQLFGMLNSVPLPLIIEMISYAEYDFVIIDQEHLLRDPVELEHTIRAGEAANLCVFVRVPGAIPHLIQQALDAGAQGIVIPCVDNAEQARIAAISCRFAPEGKRGITGGRNTGFGRLPLAQYTQQANQEVMLTVMIESEQGLNNLDDILSVPGIDMVLEGAMDLTLSLGLGDQVQHPQVQAAIQQVADAAKRKNIPFCAIPRADGQLQNWQEQGVQAFVAGEDRGILFRALKNHLSQLNQNQNSV